MAKSKDQLILRGSNIVKSVVDGVRLVCETGGSVGTDRQIQRSGVSYSKYCIIPPGCCYHPQ